MTDLVKFLTTHPGIERTEPNAHARMRVAADEGETSYLPATWIAAVMESIGLGFWANGCGIGTWVSTLDHTATVANSTGSLLFTSNATPTANDDMCINSIGAKTPVAGDTFAFIGELQVSSVDGTVGVGFTAGVIVNGSTEIQTANPTDGIFLVMTPGTTTVKLRVKGNNGTAADSTLVTNFVDSVNYRFALQCGFGATGHAWGRCLFGPVVQGGTVGNVINFTAAQVAQLVAILTTPPLLSGHVGFRVKSTTQETGTVAFAGGFITR